MFKTIRSLAVVSRVEFLPALASFFIMGLSWGINQPLSFLELCIPAVLVFAIIMLSSLIGLQLNTIFDHDLDCLDERKARLVQAFGSLRRDRLKLLLIIETLLGVVFVSLLIVNTGKLALLFMWMVGIFLAYAYSASPLKLKSKSWLALVALLLSICILPLLFAFYTFASEVDLYFSVFLIGQALSAYSLILPAEIGDYFEDKAMGIETMTVRIGLLKTSFSSILLLAMGGILTGTAFFAKLVNGSQPALTIFLLSIAFADLFVLRELAKLHFLSKEYVSSKNQILVKQEIKRVASHSTQWTILVSQTTLFVSLVFLVGKFLL